MKSYDQDRINETSTFSKRKIWYSIDDKKAPDGFFPVMQHHGPQLVLNSSKTNCTNTIHRVYFKSEEKITTKRMLSLSMLSSYSQISAELCGRSYGSGVLKHEPREAEKIRLLLPKNESSSRVKSLFTTTSKLISSNNLREARSLIDNWLGSHFGSEYDIEALNAALKCIRKMRYPDRKKS